MNLKIIALEFTPVFFLYLLFFFQGHLKSPLWTKSEWMIESKTQDIDFFLKSNTRTLCYCYETIFKYVKYGNNKNVVMQWLCKASLYQCAFYSMVKKKAKLKSWQTLHNWNLPDLLEWFQCYFCFCQCTSTIINVHI